MDHPPRPVGFSNNSPIIEAAYDPENDQSSTEVIVEALASVAEVDPLELPPLYDVIDPEVIEAIVNRPNGLGDPNTKVSFRVESWDVQIHGDGKIRIFDTTHYALPDDHRLGRIGRN